MVIIKNIIDLAEVNPQRFSRVISTISIEDPASYDVLIDVITKAKSLSGAAKTNFCKKDLEIDADLLDAIQSFVNFKPEVHDE